MTNGDFITRLFPSATLRKCTNKDITYIEVEQNNKWLGDFSLEWWNEYNVLDRHELVNLLRRNFGISRRCAKKMVIEIYNLRNLYFTDNKLTDWDRYVQHDESEV